MVNILLEGYDIGASYLYDGLKKYLRCGMTVAVVTFAFRDDRIRSAADWNGLYGREDGKYYRGIVDGFASYGIIEEDVTFLNYFTDSKEDARDKVEKADIVYFLGGLPDRMTERIAEFGLGEAICCKEIVMGYSAGALIQLAEYHLSPDEDYSEFSYYKGLPLLNDFYLEVHYVGSEVQKESICRVLSERKKKVYATEYGRGAVVVCDGRITLLGDVKEFIYGE